MCLCQITFFGDTYQEPSAFCGFCRHRLLSNKTITTESSVLEAMDVLHERGIPIVVLTSYRPSESSKEILLYGSSKKGGQRSAVKIEIPLIGASFTGTGDLLAACLLAWITRTNNLKEALEKAVATVQGVLLKTFKHSSGEPIDA